MYYYLELKRVLEKLHRSSNDNNTTNSLHNIYIILYAHIMSSRRIKLPRFL